MKTVQRRLSRSFASASILALLAPAYGQQGGDQGTLGREADGSVGAIERGISRYLYGAETKSILTPGEYVDYALNLKAGQVVVGEARSEAFDPALEIVGADQKVLASNDDRYPGDQRPLVFWRCGADGVYKARVRCFQNKSGGAVLIRFKTYETVDVGSGGPVEKEIDAGEPFLVRIPMKAGQIKEELSNVGGRGGYLSFNYNTVIGPTGLPDIVLALRLQPAIYAITAPVDGDYYIMHTPNGERGRRGTVRVATRDVVPAKLLRDGNGYVAKAPNNVPALAELTVKKGEFLQVSTPDLSFESRLVLAERLDVSKFDLAKPETNPFFPNPNRQREEEPAFDVLPGRSGDGRKINFRARRDATLWVATNGAGTSGKEFTLAVKPAAMELTAGEPHLGKLRIADYDHWAFDAVPGDVMTFDTAAAGFREVVVVRDPDLAEIRHEVMSLDQAADSWRMIVQKPGRYLVTVSALGEGGSGDYSLSRKVFPAKEFGRSTPAKGEISAGQVQVWKFTATPNDPLFIRWSSTSWNYDVDIYDEKGQPADFQREKIDGQNQVGILKVSEPQTYIIVLTGTGAKSGYSIELGGIPGSKKG